MSYAVGDGYVGCSAQFDPQAWNRGSYVGELALPRRRLDCSTTPSASLVFAAVRGCSRLSANKLKTPAFPDLQSGRGRPHPPKLASRSWVRTRVRIAARLVGRLTSLKVVRLTKPGMQRRSRPLPASDQRQHESRKVVSLGWLGERAFSRILCLCRASSLAIALPSRW